MKPTVPLMLMALLFVACGPLGQLQQLEPGNPGLGSIGKHRSGLFKKSFQKIGTPILETPVALSVQSVPFTKKMWNHYGEHLENRGMEASVKERDTGNTQELRYFEARIGDVVGLTAQLNRPGNTTLLEYLQEDTDLKLLSRISFMADVDTAEDLRSNEPIYLAENVHGSLVLVLGNGATARTIDMAGFQVFDYGVSGFCWKRDKRGRIRIAQIPMDGEPCPGETQKDPTKLDRTPDYLKP